MRDTENTNTQNHAHGNHASNGNGARSPDEIENEIRKTREAMSNTLDAIERKMSPGQLMDEVLGYFHAGSGSGNTLSSVKERVSGNPLPAAMIGAGLAWMIASPNRIGSGQMSSASSHTGDGGALHGAKDKASSAMHSAQEHISSSADSLRQRLDSARSSVHEKSSHLGEGMRERAMHAKQSSSELIESQPLLLGAAGLFLGAALAALLPTTRKEDELMGEKRDQFMDIAKEKGKEQMDKAEHVAASALESARQSAGQVAEGAKKEADRQDFTHH